MSDTAAGDLLTTDARTTSRSCGARFAYRRLSSEQVATQGGITRRTGLPDSSGAAFATQAASASNGACGKIGRVGKSEPSDRIPQLAGTERLCDDGVGTCTFQPFDRRTRRLIDERNDAIRRSTPT